MRWRGSGPRGDRDLADLLSDAEWRRRDRGLRVVVTTDVGLRGLDGDDRRSGRRPLRRAQGRRVRRRRGRAAGRPVARGPLDPDRRPGARRDVPPTGREGGPAWPLNGAKTIESAGRPWRWRGSPPWRWSRRCWSRADPARSPWPGPPACSSPRRSSLSLAPGRGGSRRPADDGRPLAPHGHDRRPPGAVRPALRVRGRAAGSHRPRRDAGGHAAGGPAEPGARARRDGPPAGLCPAVGAGQPVPGDGGLAGRRRGGDGRARCRSAASRSPARSG